MKLRVFAAATIAILIGGGLWMSTRQSPGGEYVHQDAASPTN